MPRIILASARTFKLTKNFSLLSEVDADVTTDRKRNVLIKSNRSVLTRMWGLNFF